MSFEKRTVARMTALVAGGMAVGAGLALLYAPKTGTETRRQIRHYARKAQVEATRFSRSVKAGVDKAIEAGKSLVARGEEQRAA